MKKSILLILIMVNGSLLAMQKILRIQKRFISRLTPAQQITKINNLAKRIGQRAQPVVGTEKNVEPPSRLFVHKFLSLVDYEQLESGKSNLEIEEDIENIFFTLKDDAEYKKQKPFLDRLKENKKREP